MVDDEYVERIGHMYREEIERRLAREAVDLRHTLKRVGTDPLAAWCPEATRLDEVRMVLEFGVLHASAVADELCISFSTREHDTGILQVEDLDPQALGPLRLSISLPYGVDPGALIHVRLHRVEEDGGIETRSARLGVVDDAPREANEKI